MIDRAPPETWPTSELIFWLLNRDVARYMPELRYYEIRNVAIAELDRG